VEAREHVWGLHGYTVAGALSVDNPVAGRRAASAIASIAPGGRRTLVAARQGIAAQESA